MRIVISVGDAAGIGPEIARKAVAAPAFAGVEFTVLGLPEAPVAPGKPDPANGRRAVEAVRAATLGCLERRFDALVTGPINKAVVESAGIRFSGHTGYIAELCGNPPVRMVLAGPRMKVIHVSTHIALAEACRRATRDRVLETIRIGHAMLGRLGEAAAPIAVAGLNPHSGEGGLFGGEEQREITPAIEAARAEGIPAEGPVPPDTAFYRALRGDFGMVVAMYHDQGHIPSKLIGFEETVNVTAGLPIIRTSVDHGTAYDIAGTGKASAANMEAAIRMALRLAGAPVQ
jgi:4-phospho-D-threonate 3-dehydrogenase / 4-phospho-D-erythronate 3-dehydrogenase